jgi:thioredoxin reductase (NADPH)
MASHVTIVHRRDQFRASPIMAQRALSNEKISVRWNAAVEEVVGADKVEAVRVRDTVTGELEDIPAAAMFVAIGHDPNTALFRGQLALDEAGYIVTDGTRTDVEGDHGGRQRLHGRHGRGALARGRRRGPDRDAHRGARDRKGPIDA